ncbi:MAG: hypothetical protein HYV28_07720 [Ignavibacteriales bacterium]|nr:hypothetical protein [Ignavibacteriales bacterium]
MFNSLLTGIPAVHEVIIQQQNKRWKFLDVIFMLRIFAVDFVEVNNTPETLTMIIDEAGTQQKWCSYFSNENSCLHKHISGSIKCNLKSVERS